MTNSKTVAKLSLFLNELLPQHRIVYEMVILWYEVRPRFNVHYIWFHNVTVLSEWILFQKVCPKKEKSS